MKRGTVRFVTLFPSMDVVHLKKDVGMIGYSMFCCCNFDVQLVGYHEEKDMNQFIKQNMPGIEYKQLRDIEVNNIWLRRILGRILGNDYSFKLTMLFYFMKHAKKIDVLHVFHLHSPLTQRFIKYYKFFNSKGIVYIKADLAYNKYSELQELFEKHEDQEFNIAYLLKNATIISDETQSLAKEMENYFQRKILYIPNGCMELYDWKAKISEKRDCFMTAALLDMKVKAIPILIDAFIMSSTYHDWQLILAGPYSQDMADYIDGKTANNVQLRERIVLTGNIADREELYWLYRKSKVYVCPSYSESFGISIVEAMYNSCYIICSDGVSPVADMVADDTIGIVFEKGNVNQLADYMVKATKINYEQEMLDEIQQHYLKTFSYRESAKRLEKEIYDHLK